MASKWGGILAGALGGLAGAASEIAQGSIDDKRKATLAQQLSDIEEARQLRISEAAETRRREGAKHDFEEAGRNLPETLRRSNLVTLEEAKGAAAASVDPEVRAARTLLGDDATAAQIKQVVTMAHDKNYTRALTAVADANRPTPRAPHYSPESMARAEAIRAGLAGQAQARALLAERDAIINSGTPRAQSATRVAAIDRKLAVLAASGGGGRGRAEDDGSQDTYTVDSGGVDAFGQPTPASVKATFKGGDAAARARALAEQRGGGGGGGGGANVPALNPAKFAGAGRNQAIIDEVGRGVANGDITPEQGRAYLRNLGLSTAEMRAADNAKEMARPSNQPRGGWAPQ